MRSKSGHTELSQGEVLVGRSRSCQVVLRDPSVSRSHALITVHGEDLTLKDLASSNGTFVNGEKVEGEADLAAGDHLTFGETELELGLLDREEAFSFAGLIEEVEFETAESKAFDPILETLKPGGLSPSELAALPAEGDDAPQLEIDGTPMAGVPPVFQEPAFEEPAFEEPRVESLAVESSADDSLEYERLGGGLFDEDSLPELPLDEALDELDALLSEKLDPVEEPEPSSSLSPPASPEPLKPRERLPPTPLPPRPKMTPDIAPALGSGEVKAIVDRFLHEDDAAAKAVVPVPSRDTSFLDETAEELLPSLDELDDLDAMGAPPLKSSPKLSSGGRVKSPAVAPLPATALEHMPTPRVDPNALPAAGFGIRLAAALLDAMLVMVVAGAISLLAGGPWLAEGGAVFFSVILGLSFVLHVFGWNLWGTTPAKRLFGLYVCPVGGPPGISVGSAVLRFAGYTIGLLSLGLGFVMVAFTPGRRGLHDIISGTYVGRWQR